MCVWGCLQKTTDWIANAPQGGVCASVCVCVCMCRLAGERARLFSERDEQRCRWIFKERERERERVAIIYWCWWRERWIAACVHSAGDECVCWKQQASEYESALSLRKKLQKPDYESTRTDLFPCYCLFSECNFKTSACFKRTARWIVRQRLKLSEP